MPEYYYDEDIDNNRLGILNILASNLEYLTKLIQTQHIPTKKELCQDMYDKPFMPVHTNISAKKEFGGNMFGQNAPGMGTDYPRMLLPLTDMPTSSMASLHDLPMASPLYQRPMRQHGVSSAEMSSEFQNRSQKNFSTVVAGDSMAPPGNCYRVSMRDASTSTSPMNVEDMDVTSQLDSKEGPFGMEMKSETLCSFKSTADDVHCHITDVRTMASKPEKMDQSTLLVIKPPRSSSSPLPPAPCNGSGHFANEVREGGDHASGCEGSTTCAEAACSTKEEEDDGSPEKAQIHKCGHCSELFKARRALVKHMRMHPSEKAYPCDQCGKLFSRNSALINHKRTHTKDKAYMCDQCGLTMPTRNDLSSHELTHVGVRPFVCQDCGKSFKKAGALSTHRKLHTGDTPFVCEFCGKAFTSNGNLENHLRVHSGDKPYSCEYCGKAFNTTANLNRHVRIHTGEKPYVCDWCNKAFSQSYALVIHKRIHTGEQPYFCKQCGKTFSDNSTLYKHKRIHKDSSLTEDMSKMSNRKPPVLEMVLMNNAMQASNASNNQANVMHGPIGMSPCSAMAQPGGAGLMPVSTSMTTSSLIRMPPPVGSSVSSSTSNSMMMTGPSAHMQNRLAAYVGSRSGLPMMDPSNAAMHIHNPARNVHGHPAANDGSMVVS